MIKNLCIIGGIRWIRKKLQRVSCFIGNLADHLELCSDLGTDFDPQKRISVDSAFTDPTVLFVWVFYGFGISLSVIANVIMNSGEAFVKAVSDKIHKNFGNVKIGFDVMCVILSVALSFLFFQGEIVGTREGTVICALFTGVVVKFFTSVMKEPLEEKIL